MEEKLIYLVRHAQPDFPGGVRMCLGRKSDLPLSPSGFEQASALGRFFQPLPIEAVFTSPLLRARQTAEAISAKNRPLCVLDSLSELDGGEWDGLTFDQIHERYPGYFLPGSPHACPPGGETDAQGLARMQAALEDAANRIQRCAVVVAHAGVNRLLLCTLMGRPLSEKRLLPQGYASVSLLARTDGVWRLEAIDLDTKAEQ